MKIQLSSERVVQDLEQHLLTAAQKFTKEQNDITENDSTQLEQYLKEIVLDAMEIFKQNIGILGVPYYEYEPKLHAPLEDIDPILIQETEELGTKLQERLAHIGGLQRSLTITAEKREREALLTPCLDHYDSLWEERMKEKERVEGGETEIGLGPNYGENLKAKCKAAAETIAKVNVALPRLLLELDHALPANHSSNDTSMTNEDTVPTPTPTPVARQKSRRRSRRSQPYKMPK